MRALSWLVCVSYVRRATRVCECVVERVLCLQRAGAAGERSRSRARVFRRLPTCIIVLWCFPPVYWCYEFVPGIKQTFDSRADSFGRTFGAGRKNYWCFRRMR